MLRHAYLIIAHSNWEQLKVLLEMLDESNNALYIHIDAKAKQVPIMELQKTVKKAFIQIFQEYKVYWGSFELVQTELFLFKQAYPKHYDYYHLLSGTDLPIKSQKEIDDFFSKNKGCEFVQYDTDERLRSDNEIIRRTRYYHYLQNYRRRYKIKLLNESFTFLERVSLVIQMVLRIDRLKKHSGFPIKYGSQWVSITDDLVKHIIQNEQLITDVFHCTNCADELFIQTLVFNSEFKERLYDKNYDDSVCGNMRLIDLKTRGQNGNPYTWRVEDLQEIQSSKCLFARKFDLSIDSEVVRFVFERNKKQYG